MEGDRTGGCREGRSSRSPDTTGIVEEGEGGREEENDGEKDEEKVDDGEEVEEKVELEEEHEDG